MNTSTGNGLKLSWNDWETVIRCLLKEGQSRIAGYCADEAHAQYPQNSAITRMFEIAGHPGQTPQPQKGKLEDETP